jgi:membrane-bound lytic murein transglycosylase B
MGKQTIVFILISSFFLSLISFGSTPAHAIDCLTITPSASTEDKNYCKNELARIEAELAQLLEKQKEQQKQTGTLKGDVDFLNAQINALKTKIKARGLAIAELKVNITEKVNKIESLSEKIEREHESLAQLLRNTREFDDKNLVNLVLSNSTVSDFYNDLESYNSIKQAVKDSIDIINGVKKETEEEKQDLEKKRNAETDAKAELESAQNKVAKSEAEKRELLSISKQQEESYRKLAAEKKARADRIRSALFSLAGTSQKIEFGTALTYAQNVQKILGVDPAFVLAILTQESNLGANVGQCYLTNTETGAGVGKNTGTVFTNVMKPTRDVVPFLDITAKLGYNAFQTAVSCPIIGVAGWGGAMGPAQFIPSTWKLYENRLKNALGHYPNPWTPPDAFMASGMYLADLGAIGNSASAQHIAACKYYGSGGSSCGYSKSVMTIKARIQADIDTLEAS